MRRSRRACRSSAVLRALARTLRLSDASTNWHAAWQDTPPNDTGGVPQHIGPSVQRLLDRLANTPIAVFDTAWTLLEHNQAAL